MLKGVTNTFKEHCNNIELTYNEYIVIEGQTIPVRAKLSDDCYDNGNFVGSFILKTIQFETSNDVKFRNKEFEYYKVVDGESIKIGTFITTEITDNDTTELVKVVGMDYGLKTQVEYTSSLDYSSGNVTLMDVWNECCELSGIESGVDTFENADFIVDSDQFTGTGAMIRDVFIGIALSSGSFIKVMNDDKIYPIFKAHTESLSETSINTTTTLENVLEIDKINELKGDTQQDSYTGKNLFTTDYISSGEATINDEEKNDFTITEKWANNMVINDNVLKIFEPGTQYTLSAKFKILSRPSSLGSNNRDRIFGLYNGGTITNIMSSSLKNTGALNTEYSCSTTFTTPSDLTNYIILGYCYKDEDNVTQGEIEIIELQIEQGSTATYFEPYVGGVASPNPDYPQEIKTVTGKQEIDIVGKNLFDFTDIKEQSTGITTDDNGWITVTGDNSSGSSTLFKNYYTNKTDRLKPSTTYKVICEIKTKTGTIRDLTITSNATTSQANTTNTIPNADATNNRIIVRNFTTKSDFSNCDIMIRSYVAFAPGNSGSLTFRISVVEDTSITPETFSYEPYKGKSYEINLGKNLFNNNGTMYQSTGATVETIDTGIRATVLQTGNNKFGKVVIPNSDELLGKTVTLSANFSPSASNTGRIALYQINSAGGTVSSIGMLGNTGSTTLTIPSEYSTNAVALALLFYANTSGTSEVNDYVDYTNVQLELGSQATSYSEYFEPIELNRINTYQDSIKKSTGKNLFDKDNATLNYRLGSDGTPYSDNNYVLSDYIPVLPSSYYMYSRYASGGGSGAVAFYDSNKTFISRILFGGGSTSNTYIQITTPENTKYIRLTDLKGLLNNMQIEKGTQSSSYEPYLPKGTWYLEKQTRKLELNSNNISGNDNYPTISNISIIKEDYPNLNTANFRDYTKYIVNVSGLSIQNNAIGVNTLYTGSIILNKSYFNLTTTQWRENYTNLEIVIIYGLKTSEYTEITNTELINQLESIELLKGLNNISITSEDLTPTIDMTYWNNDSEVIEDYTDLEDKRDTHPWTCVRLGLSQVDGENVDLIDEELVEEYGENWLILNDNPFAYNQTKREQLITAIFNKVKGFGYSSFVSKTSFKPYLTCGDTVKFKNKNGDLIDSILLRYTHEFKENDMQITLEAPSETTAEVKYIYPLTAIDLNKRTQIEVDKENVKITSLTAQASNIETNLANNYYTIDQANQLVQTAQTGLTNTFSEAGGNNIFRNTGLWFTQSDSSNPYEFWNGNVVKYKEENASNMSALLLQNNTLYQEQLVPNGNYTISFKYKKLVQLATIKCKINDTEYILDSLNEEEFIQSIEVNSQHINVQFISDTNNSCEIYDLMVNAGAVKLAYSQNQNETTTETVNISKGITITSSDIETTFKANADGVRIYANNDLNNPKTKFTDKGTETDYLKVNDEAEVVDILIQRVGSHTWLTKI